jgi:hypothetical protein
MRPVRILLVALALVAVGLTGWALGARDPYRRPAADPAATQVTPPATTPAAPSVPAHWRCADQPLLAHLTVRATGPGGTTEQTVGVYHPDPERLP